VEWGVSNPFQNLVYHLEIVIRFVAEIQAANRDLISKLLRVALD